jgi:Asp-tRNA(Asn)/Glu-tRNA(Gln) amidotransferase A subunit family amidase
MSSLHYMSATEAHRRIRSRELSPVELTQAVLERAERLDDQLHAFVTLDHERALEAARQAEAAVPRGAQLGSERGGTLGLLHGLPVSIKDLEPTAGLRTTYGSKFFEHYVPDYDGAVAGRLRAAGAILFGKTNTPNMGHKDVSDNLLMPATRNPWNLARTPGGSSGGAAAAVAAGIGPLALGSDGAGSIRIPAALSGVFGFKPSFGRVPYWPNADFWAARSHYGPLSRTVRDAALMLNAIAGPDPRDPLSLDSPMVDFVAECDRGLRGLRVAWSVDFGYAAVDREVRQLTLAAARRFVELGCEVEDVTPPWSNPAEWASLLWDVSTAIRNVDRLEQHPEWIEPSMREQIERGLAASTREVGAAQLERTRFYEQARQFMESFDLLLTPQMPCGAWSYAAPPAAIDGTPTPALFDRLSFTFPFNLTGWPAASVPCGFNSEGLPVALQVVAKHRQDGLCLRAAAAFEALQPWADHVPQLASA